MRGAIFATIMVCILGACSLSDKDKDRVVEIGEQVSELCVGLEGEEWRDCMVEEAIRLGEKKLEEASD